MYSKTKLKLYILVIAVLFTVVLIKYNYQKQFVRNAFIVKEIIRNENMIKKIKEKRKNLSTIKNSLKIASDKLKKLKITLFRAKEPSETLESLQKYVFDYLANKGFEISDYRQLPVKEEKSFYICRIEVNFRANTDELLNIFDYFSTSNYLIIIDNFNVNYFSSKNKKLRVRIVFSTIYLKKLDEV